jgi:hypothetical protein
MDNHEKTKTNISSNRPCLYGGSSKFILALSRSNPQDIAAVSNRRKAPLTTPPIKTIYTILASMTLLT